MKKRAGVILAVILVISGSGVALAGQMNYGCGLGTMIFGNDESLSSQVAAAGINWAFSSQPLGIASGTSNCEKPESLVFNNKVKTFVADNMDGLAQDMAQGQGEYLETLAVLMDVPPENRPALYGKLQENFTVIYASDEVTSDEVVQGIAAVM